MIKFKALVHKETGAVINYLDWLRCINNELTITIYRGNEDNIKFVETDAKEALFSDNFEVVYDDLFTIEELKLAHTDIEMSSEEYTTSNVVEEQNLSSKISKLIEKRECIKNKYGIEI